MGSSERLQVSLGRPRGVGGREADHHTSEGGEQYGQSGKGEWKGEDGRGRKRIVLREYHQGKL